MSGEFSPPAEDGDCEFVPDQQTTEAAEGDDALGVSALQVEMSTSETNDSEDVEQKVRNS